mmetsp:Transcript_29711/g.63152  ORF Transcript_29711/g.63152 Transcript_29711/m.63152 type:complete len:323 (-) Transcript_29711:218-1186(-)
MSQIQRDTDRIESGLDGSSQKGSLGRRSLTSSPNDTPDELRLVAAALSEAPVEQTMMLHNVAAILAAASPRTIARFGGADKDYLRAVEERATKVPSSKIEVQKTPTGEDLRRSRKSSVTRSFPFEDVSSRVDTLAATWPPRQGHVRKFEDDNWGSLSLPQGTSMLLPKEKSECTLWGSSADLTKSRRTVIKPRPGDNTHFRPFASRCARPSAEGQPVSESVDASRVPSKAPTTTTTTTTMTMISRSASLPNIRRQRLPPLANSVGKTSPHKPSSPTSPNSVSSSLSLPSPIAPYKKDFLATWSNGKMTSSISVASTSWDSDA